MAIIYHEFRARAKTPERITVGRPKRRIGRQKFRMLAASAHGHHDSDQRAGAGTPEENTASVDAIWFGCERPTLHTDCIMLSAVRTRECMKPKSVAAMRTVMRTVMRSVMFTVREENSS